MLPTKFQAVWRRGERYNEGGEQKRVEPHLQLLFSFNKNILEANKRNIGKCQFWMGYVLVYILISVFFYFYIFQIFLKMKI